MRFNTLVCVGLQPIRFVIGGDSPRHGPVVAAVSISTGSFNALFINARASTALVAAHSLSGATDETLLVVHARAGAALVAAYFIGSAVQAFVFHAGAGAALVVAYDLSDAALRHLLRKFAGRRLDTAR